MGNMHYPSINRWGYNLFWLNYWFSDKLKSLNIQQDILLDQLISYYFIFGYFNKKNFQVSSYWYNDYIRKEHDIFFDNYEFDSFRIVKNIKTTKVSLDYFIFKNEIPETSYVKIWIFRYQKWLILFFFSLNFIRDRKATKPISTNELFESITPIKWIPAQKLTYFKKLFFFLFFLKTNFFFYNF